MFKMRSRSKNKAVLGGSPEEEAALDDDEDKGLQFTVKEDSERENEDSNLVFKKTHRRQSSRSLPKMDILSLQSELANGNCVETSDHSPTEPELNGKEWFRTWPENKRVKDLSTDDNCPPIANNNYQKKTRQTIPLDQLLQSMPIAYSPVTKQLHVVAKEPEVSLELPEEQAEEESFNNCKSSSPMSSLSNISRMTVDSSAHGPSSPSMDDDSTSTASLRDAFLSQGQSSSGADCKSKQTGGFSNLFSKGLLNWKGSSKDAGLWKLFGRKTPAESQGSEEALPMQGSSRGSLILEARPSHLPAKSPEEEERHRLEYEQMVQAAKKKEQKEAKQKKKQLQQQLKVEDLIANSAKMWTTEVLPKWELNKSSKKVRDLWWQGIPPCVRGKVWRLSVGNELNITPDLYQICVSRALDRLQAAKSSNNMNQDAATESDKESSVQLIQLDIARTFPLLCIFQKGGPYYNTLHSLLGAYVCYRPDVGYVQGMSFIAAVLILNLEPADAFVCLANMLNRPCLRAFYRMDEALINAYYATYNDLLQENLPNLSRHFETQALTPDLYLLDWMYTMFSRAMPLDVTCRVWDVFLRDGEEFLFRTALGVVHMYQETLKELDFLQGSQFLTKLPDDICSDTLFRSIDLIRLNVGKLKFDCVLAKHNEGSNSYA